MLKLQNVTVIYPDKTKAVDNVSISLDKGENAALLGGNGAGKTSMILAAVGILDLESGTVEADGIQLGKKTVNDIRKKIGLVFQNPDDQLFMPLVYDDVTFGCRNLGMPEDAVKDRVEETLKRLNISHLRERSPMKLSGGEKRMAAIATVLSMNPSILMLDEPTAFLDPKAVRALAEALNKLGQAKLIATHDIAFAAKVCGRVILLKDGRVAADGTTALLYDKTIMEDCGLEAVSRP